jgi:hypothetical protein
MQELNEGEKTFNENFKNSMKCKDWMKGKNL